MSYLFCPERREGRGREGLGLILVVPARPTQALSNGSSQRIQTARQTAMAAALPRTHARARGTVDTGAPFSLLQTAEATRKEQQQLRSQQLP